MIVDESVTSFSRCGILGFLSGRWADIIVVGEQIANGLPIAALGFREDVIIKGFAPEVGWPYMSHVMCNITLETLMWMKEYMDCQKFVDFALKWIEKCEQLVEDG